MIHTNKGNYFLSFCTIITYTRCVKDVGYIGFRFMTLVIRNHSEHPGTHVLIVGVGSYPTFPGYVPGQNTMGQIDSAEIGAQSVANWFAQKFHNPSKPLASLRLLLSNDHGNQWESAEGVQQVDAATSDNFLDAYDAWIADADAQPGSTLVLYFAGHGIGSWADHSLICENYNAAPKRRMEGAVDYNNVLYAIANKSKSSHVWIFIDSCRVSEIAQAINGDYGRKVDDGTGPIGKIGGPKISTFFATSPGGEAHGNAGAPSFFAEAVVKAFESNAFDRRNGRDWACFTDVAFRAISKQLERIYVREDFDLATRPVPYQWNADSDSFLHCLPAERLPTMMVEISCDPDSDNATHTIFWKQGVQETLQQPSGQVWRTELTPGYYSFGAIGGDGRRCRNKNESVVLPFHYIFVG
ncbi:caspase family protein [Massilia aurea]|uniref:caspase family protein n=1 Tax=Massilia aurea TaxID=373040 RepID=UPI00346230B7